MPWRVRGSGEEAAKATFRVWEQQPQSAADDGEGQGEREVAGRWVAYPSVVVTEGPVDAEEARFRARVAAGFKGPREGERKCQPPVPRWMCGLILVGMPVILAVGLGVVAVEKGRGWWREKGEKKARKVEEEAARWKVEEWDGEEA